MLAGAAEESESSGVRLRLLEGFELSIDGASIRTTPSLRKVIAYLAIKNRPVRRCSLAGVLWPETTESRARANLRSTLCRIAPPCAAVLDLRGDMVALQPQVSVDVHEALLAADHLLNDTEPPPGDLDARLFRGELLPEIGDSWVTTEREHARQVFLHALEALAAYQIEQGRLPLAIMAALTAIGMDPLRESATRLLIQAHLAEGNRSEAHRALISYSEILRNELDLDPSAELVRLVQV